jgi:hypothetical protein
LVTYGEGRRLPDERLESGDDREDVRAVGEAQHQALQRRLVAEAEGGADVLAHEAALVERGGRRPVEPAAADGGGGRPQMVRRLEEELQRLHKPVGSAAPTHELS